MVSYSSSLVKPHGTVLWSLSYPIETGETAAATAMAMEAIGPTSVVVLAGVCVYDNRVDRIAMMKVLKARSLFSLSLSLFFIAHHRRRDLDAAAESVKKKVKTRSLQRGNQNSQLDHPKT